MQHPTTGGIPMPVPINRPRLGRGAPLTAERELYLRPVTQGMSNIEACRKVGIHRITGVRWRDGRTMVDSGLPTRHYAPITTHPNSISPGSCRRKSEYGMAIYDKPATRSAPWLRTWVEARRRVVLGRRHSNPSRAAAWMVGTVGRKPSSRTSAPSIRPDHGLSKGSADPGIGTPAIRVIS